MCFRWSVAHLAMLEFLHLHVCDIMLEKKNKKTPSYLICIQIENKDMHAETDLVNCMVKMVS